MTWADRREPPGWLKHGDQGADRWSEPIDPEIVPGNGNDGGAHYDENARAHHRSEADHSRAAETKAASEAVGMVCRHGSSRTVFDSACDGTRPPSRLVVMGAGSRLESSDLTT